MSNRQQQQHNKHNSQVDRRHVQEVWANNLHPEMERMRDVAEQYPCVSMETLLPGIIARPTGVFSNYAEYNYQMMKCNVDLGKVIRLILAFTDQAGRRPDGTSTWAFNFALDVDKDMLHPAAVDRLRSANGVDLERHRSQGCSASSFAEILMSSGIVLSDEVRWVTVAGAGDFSDQPPVMRGKAQPEEGAPLEAFRGMYNFGHLLQILTSEALPDEAQAFFDTLDLFFPNRCDLGWKPCGPEAKSHRIGANGSYTHEERVSSRQVACH